MSTKLALLTAVLVLGLAAPTSDPGLLVGTDWLAAHLDDSRVVVVHVGFASDVTGRPTFEAGHIPFARPLDWTEIAVTRDGLPNEFPYAERLTESIRLLGADHGDTIVLYDTGSGLEAARALVAFEYVGLRPKLLDGMWAKWTREGRDVSTTSMGVEPSGFVPLLDPRVVAPLRMVADVAWVALEREGTALLLDARPFEEFIGQRPGKDVPRPGHIPGAMNLPWWTVFREESGLYRPEEELRTLFERKGARPGLRLIVYCRSGTEAGPLYVAARLLDYPVSLYDGSFVEWSATPGLPVANHTASFR